MGFFLSLAHSLSDATKKSGALNSIISDDFMYANAYNSHIFNIYKLDGCAHILLTDARAYTNTVKYSVAETLHRVKKRPQLFYFTFLFLFFSLCLTQCFSSVSL